MGQVVTISQLAGFSGRFARLAAIGVLVVLLAGCNLFGSPKIKEEAIVPPDTLYQQALGEMDKQQYHDRHQDAREAASASIPTRTSTRRRS